MTSTKSSGGSGGGKAHSTPKASLPRHRAHLVSGDSASSTQWLRRQLSDPYVRQAKQENLASRAAFKLQQIDDKHHILKKGKCVLDLGCSPGGWTQVAAKRVAGKAGGRPGLVVGVDIKPVDIVVDGATFLQLDMSSPDALPAIINAMEQGGYDKADAVISDMAPSASGIKSVDHIRLMELGEVALGIAESVLAPGGSFLAKVSRGGEENQFKDRLVDLFKEVVSVKPDASRSDSAEIYFLGKGFGAGKKPPPS